ncbi:MAG: VWA domain-containing protein [Spirochaetales bacterium]|nr:VWA domain-containing protein [Spirochaetales bacterium]
MLLPRQRQARPGLIFFLTIVLVLTCGLRADTAKSIEDLALQLAKLDQPAARLAVLPFTDQSGRITEEGSLIQERLTTVLVNQGKFQILERRMLDQLLRENARELTGLMADRPDRLGQLLGVDILVLGTTARLGQVQEINARMVRPQSGQILLAARAQILEGVAHREDPAALPPSVQIALLLDTSGSMDGLIEQARARLWKLVSELAYAEKDGKSPQIEVALFEYGNDGIAAGEGYIRMVSPFASDLDAIFAALVNLKTNGGQEYAGQAIQQALRRLQWKDERAVYRTIFIAGNEAFQQGPIDFKEAIREAQSRGIIVNTIYCGERTQGEALGWASGALAGGGAYMHIDQDRTATVEAAPQDAEIRQLTDRLHDNVLPAGPAGKSELAREKLAQKSAAGKQADIDRALFSARKASSRSWDLVSRYENGQLDLDRLKEQDLPADLRGKDSREVRKILDQRVAERKAIQDRLTALRRERQLHIQRSAPAASPALDDAMLRAIKKQATGLSFK